MTNQTDMHNLPVRAVSIMHIDHPEWGTFGITEDRGEYYGIRGRSGDTVLFKDEAAKFWRVV